MTNTDIAYSRYAQTKQTTHQDVSSQFFQIVYGMKMATA